jgi:hypothetical protein
LQSLIGDDAGQAEMVTEQVFHSDAIIASQLQELFRAVQELKSMENLFLLLLDQPSYQIDSPHRY